jgi:hypothetical protein
VLEHHGVPLPVLPQGGGGACGTPLTYRHDNHVDTLDITTCSLDEPGRFPPTHHSWLGHDPRWVKFGDSLPGFQEFRPKESA